MSDSDLLSLEEVWSSETINREVAREAYNQVSQRLSDVLEAKKTFDQKALSLFAGYVTLTLAAFGLAANAATAESPLHDLFAPLVGIGLFFGAGALMFVVALWDADYGSLGSAPETWLRKDIIQSSDDGMVYRVMASVVRRYHERIAISVKSNQSKVVFIRAGMILGAAAPSCMLVYALLVRG